MLHEAVFCGDLTRHTSPSGWNGCNAPEISRTVFGSSHDIYLTSPFVFFFSPPRSVRSCCCSCFAAPWVPPPRGPGPPRWVWQLGWLRAKGSPGLTSRGVTVTAALMARNTQYLSVNTETLRNYNHSVVDIQCLCLHGGTGTDEHELYTEHIHYLCIYLD